MEPILLLALALTLSVVQRIDAVSFANTPRTHVLVGFGATRDLRFSSDPEHLEPFRIRQIDAAMGAPVLSFSNAATNSYVVLYRGTNLTTITTPVALALCGPCGEGSLRDTTRVPTPGTLFYSLLQVWTSAPLDLDGDGMDDLYELQHPAFLNALVPTDANLDFDGDGKLNLEEYRAGTNPAFTQAALAVSANHRLALRKDGSLWAWGENASGQLGDGTFLSRSEPRRIGEETSWVTVATATKDGADTLSGGLKRDGSLWLWGNGRATPERVGVDQDWSALSIGAGTVGAIKSDGTLWTWAWEGGPLKICPFCGEYEGKASNEGKPYRVKAKAVAAGAGYFAVIAADGALWTWGCPTEWSVLGHPDWFPCEVRPVRVGSDTNWIAVSASALLTMALRSDGSLWIAGRWPDGSGYEVFTRYDASTDWVAISAGGDGGDLLNVAAAALKRDGSLWTAQNGIWVLSRVGSLSDSWSDLAAGGSYTSGPWAIRSDGSLWSATDVPLSLVQRSPVQVGSDGDWAAAIGGSATSAALKTDGSLWMWGNNQFGQLVGGGFPGSVERSPRPVPTAARWRSVAISGVHTVAVSQNGELWSWGANHNGQLGIGSDSTEPPFGTNVPVRVGTGTNWQKVAVGFSSTLGLQTDGSLWAWGWNYFGQLGIGPGPDASYPFSHTNGPVRVGETADWRMIATGDGTSLGVRADGTLYGWGVNFGGQVGDGTTGPKFVPTRIGLSSHWVAAATRNGHSLGLQSDGSLWAWGAEQYGELGDGIDQTNRLTPYQIGRDSDWRSISLGPSHTVALKTDGSLWAWGYNNGLLGDGTTTHRNIPTRIGMDTNWASVSAGLIGSLAVTVDHTLWAWGWNNYYELGIEIPIPLERLGTGTNWGTPP